MIKMKDERKDIRVIEFGSWWVDGILISVAVLGLFVAIWLMADIMPRGAKGALLVTIVALVCLSCRDVLSRMAVFALRTPVEALVYSEVEKNEGEVKVDVNEAYNGPEWDITQEESEALDDYIDEFFSEVTNELWLKSHKNDSSRGLKCEYAGNWWKNARGLHN